MKKFIKILFYATIFIYLVIIFVPKKELFFLAEQYLEKNRIILSDETHSDYGLLFKIDDGSLYYDRLKIAQPNSISLLTTILYNQIYFDSILLEGTLSAFIPKRIDSAALHHTIFLPHIIFIKADGEIGAVSGTIDLFQREIELQINAPAKIVNSYKDLFRLMKKGENGFTYRANF